MNYEREYTPASSLVWPLRAAVVRFVRSGSDRICFACTFTRRKRVLSVSGAAVIRRGELKTVVLKSGSRGKVARLFEESN